MKELLLVAVLALLPWGASVAVADTVDLLSIWEADKPNNLGGVDEDGDGAIDEGTDPASCPTAR